MRLPAGKQGRQLPPGKDWKTAEQKVLRLQIRIAKAAKQKKYRLMRSLQWLLAHSFYAKLPAVRRVTSNKVDALSRRPGDCETTIAFEGPEPYEWKSIMSGSKGGSEPKDS